VKNQINIKKDPGPLDPVIDKIMAWRFYSDFPTSEHLCIRAVEFLRTIRSHDHLKITRQANGIVFEWDSAVNYHTFRITENETFFYGEGDGGFYEGSY
jgi:hypothetical protein